MKNAMPDDVLAFGSSAQRSLQRLGGIDLALRTEADRSLRGPVGAALKALGVGELDVRGDGDQLLAAAELCRVSGSLVLPWPLVEELMAVDGARLALVNSRSARVEHGDLPADWLACDLDGQAFDLVMGEPGRAKLGPFLVPAELATARETRPSGDVARHLVLGSWRLLGGVQAALAQVVDHVGVRVQFGRPLSEFQSVRFTIADATVQVRGFEELAKFTVWRLTAASPERALADALALRLHGARKAVQILRTCHQLLGAVGFCDEHDVSVLDRHLQPLVRLPLSAEALSERLVQSVSRGDLESLFA
jgi:acyl-CoA dehydrogenase